MTLGPFTNKGTLGLQGWVQGICVLKDSVAGSGLGALFNHPGELLRSTYFSHQITP